MRTRFIVILAFIMPLTHLSAHRDNTATGIVNAENKIDVLSAVDASSLAISADDRVVDGDGEESVSDSKESEDLSNKSHEDKSDLDNKNSDTADVQVVYRVRGDLNRNLREHVEVGMSEVMCGDEDAYYDCHGTEKNTDLDLVDKDKQDITIPVSNHNYDVIGYEVIDRENGQAPEEERLRGSEAVVERSTEVVYRENGDPAFEREHRVLMREQGTGRVYSATIKEATQRDPDAEKTSEEVEEESASARKTLWLSRLERESGEL